MPGNEVRIGARLNGWYNSDGSLRTTVKKQANHPDFDRRSINNDYMLLLLEESFELAGNTRLVLSDKESDYAPDTVYHVMGLGMTEFGFVSGELLDAEVKKFSQPTCESIYGAPPTGVTESMICAGVLEGGVDSCQGDRYIKEAALLLNPFRFVWD